MNTIMLSNFSDISKALILNTFMYYSFPYLSKDKEVE